MCAWVSGAPPRAVDVQLWRAEVGRPGSGRVAVRDVEDQVGREVLLGHARGGLGAAAGRRARPAPARPGRRRRRGAWRSSLAQVCDPSAVHEWGPDHLDDLVGLTDAALPDERLTSDELLACCWEDPGVVLGLPDAAGAVSVVLRHFGDRPAAFVKLVVVDPTPVVARATVAPCWPRPSSGRGTRGATELHLSGSAPSYLWPGVDVRATADAVPGRGGGLRRDRRGLRHVGAGRVPSSGARTGSRSAGRCRDADAASVDELVAREWPNWVDEQRRGNRTGHVPGRLRRGHRRRGRLRLPLGEPGRLVRPDRARRRRTATARIGLALLGEVCTDLQVAGFRDVEICWIGPVGFYAAAGGSISRVYRTYRRPQALSVSPCAGGRAARGSR